MHLVPREASSRAQCFMGGARDCVTSHRILAPSRAWLCANEDQGEYSCRHTVLSRWQTQWGKALSASTLSLQPCLQSTDNNLYYCCSWDNKGIFRGAHGEMMLVLHFPLFLLITSYPKPSAHQAQLTTLMVRDQRRVLQVDDATLIWAQPRRRDSQGVI